jgi:hypothetical protein
VFDGAHELHAHDLEVELVDARPAGRTHSRERRRSGPSGRPPMTVAWMFLGAGHQGLEAAPGWR